MCQRETKLPGRTEIDNAYIGGENSGKRGRGPSNNTPFVADVETTQDGSPLQMHLHMRRYLTDFEYR